MLISVNPTISFLCGPHKFTALAGYLEACGAPVGYLSITGCGIALITLSPSLHGFRNLNSVFQHDMVFVLVFKRDPHFCFVLKQKSLAGCPAEALGKEVGECRARSSCPFLEFTEVGPNYNFQKPVLNDFLQQMLNTSLKFKIALLINNLHSTVHHPLEAQSSVIFGGVYPLLTQFLNIFITQGRCPTSFGRYLLSPSLPTCVNFRQPPIFLSPWQSLFFYLSMLLYAWVFHFFLLAPLVLHLCYRFLPSALGMNVSPITHEVLTLKHELQSQPFIPQGKQPESHPRNRFF